MFVRDRGERNELERRYCLKKNLRGKPLDNEEGFLEDVRQCALIAQRLITRLEPEPEFVRKLVEQEARRIIVENEWKEISEQGKPWVKTLEREKYVLRIAVIHARKGERITGADLAFELKDRKIILIQSKKVGSNGRFVFSRLQLLKLAELEAQLNSRRYPVIMHAFPQTYLCPIAPSKGAAFYHLIMIESSQTQERFFHISEISFTLSNRKSVSQDEFINMGITLKEFDDMFWHCKIGAPDMKEELKGKILELYSLITNRMIVWLHVEEKSGYSS